MATMQIQLTPEQAAQLQCVLMVRTDYCEEAAARAKYAAMNDMAARWDERRKMAEEILIVVQKARCL